MGWQPDLADDVERLPLQGTADEQINVMSGIQQQMHADMGDAGCTADLRDVSDVDEGVRPLVANAIHQAADNLCDVRVVVPAMARIPASRAPLSLCY